jgi:hypothetical protein
MPDWKSIFALSLLALSVQAQVLQEWTHSSVYGESSAVVSAGSDHMFVADNEDELLRLYPQQPTAACAAPIGSFNARPHLSLSSSNPEADLEAAARQDTTNGTRIYWLASHSNSTGGNLRTNRFRLFATEMTGDGTGSPPYALSYVGRYDHLRTDLTSWDRNNVHGLGSNHLGLAGSTNVGISSEATNGFNLEGLAFAPDGSNAWLAFRTPLVNGYGPTTNLASRTHALIVPLKNIGALVAGSPTPGPGVAQFGSPILLDLGRRGIRSLDRAADGTYLITAGPPGDVSSPPSAPLNFRLFTWTGNPLDAPLERTTSFPSGYSPEGALLPDGGLSSNSVVRFVSDDANSCWKSFTTPLGTTVLPTPFELKLTPNTNDLLQLHFIGQTGFTYVVESSPDFAHWELYQRFQCVTNPTTLGPTSPAAAVSFFRGRY